jgi:hypothetical protein
MAQWAEDALLSVFLDLKGRAPLAAQNSTLPTVSSTNAPPVKPIAELRRVDIGGDRHINTLHLRSTVEQGEGIVDQGNEKKVIVMAHGYGAGLGFFYKVCHALNVASRSSQR